MSICPVKQKKSGLMEALMNGLFPSKTTGWSGVCSEFNKKPSNGHDDLVILPKNFKLRETEAIQRLAERNARLTARRTARHLSDQNAKLMNAFIASKKRRELVMRTKEPHLPTADVKDLWTVGLNLLRHYSMETIKEESTDTILDAEALKALETRESLRNFGLTAIGNAYAELAELAAADAIEHCDPEDDLEEDDPNPVGLGFSIN